MENIVYNELLVRGYNVDVGIVDVFTKNSEGKRVHKQLEVDFVVNQSSQRYYIQVAYDMTSEEKQTQELNSFRNIPDSFKKIVIVNGTKKPWRNEEGFVIMGMKYFCSMRIVWSFSMAELIYYIVFGEFVFFSFTIC